MVDKLNCCSLWSGVPESMMHCSDLPAWRSSRHDHGSVHIVQLWHCQTQ